MLLALCFFLVTWISSSSTDTPGCPPFRPPLRRCSKLIQHCNQDSDCKEGELCCNVECGRDCTPPQPANCLLPKKVGPCENKFSRYYYDANSTSCKRFTYGGCDGNANNFLELADCQRECTSWSVICSLPEERGRCKASDRRYYYQKYTKSCWKFTYGECNGNANNFQTLAECLQKCDNEPNVCSLPKQKGKCRAYHKMYYYNTTTKSCETFIYGGCGGNANKFETLGQCQLICDVCSLPKQKGLCSDSIPRYYYDTMTKSCEKFIYGGCYGNDNNFETLEECKQSCDNNSNGMTRNGNKVNKDPCSDAPKCVRPPPWICFEPTYRIIDGVKCHWCYQIIPCPPDGGLGM